MEKSRCGSAAVGGDGHNGDLAATGIQRHEWEKKHLQRETAPRGHLRRGRFAIELTEHMESMKDDRTKKAALYTGVVGVLLARQRELGVEALHPDLH